MSSEPHMSKKMKKGKYWVISGVCILAAFAGGYLLCATSNGDGIQEEKKPQMSQMEHGVMKAPEAGTIPEITLSKKAQILAQIEVSEVMRKPVTITTPFYGTIDYDETRLARIAAWVAGRIDALYVDYLGSPVDEGQAMALIYSPELITAQSELIESKRILKDINESTLAFIKRSSQLGESASYQKLRLLGITDKQISEILDRGIPSDHLTLHAPLGGTVIDLKIREGVYVKTGESLYAIADLTALWLICEAYESDLQWIKLGKEVVFQVEAFPGQDFKGTVSYIDPMVNEKTRTVRVRIDVPNKQNLLKPGMFVQALQQTYVSEYQNQMPIVIPASAPLITGKRAVVYIEKLDKPGTYEGRVITLGPKAGDFYIVEEGLNEGERVVTNGNFKIDSAMQIQAKPSMMNPATKPNVIFENLPGE